MCFSFFVFSIATALALTQVNWVRVRIQVEVVTFGDFVAPRRKIIRQLIADNDGRLWIGNCHVVLF